MFPPPDIDEQRIFAVADDLNRPDDLACRARAGVKPAPTGIKASGSKNQTQ
jgi:hypothetical protein